MNAERISSLNYTRPQQLPSILAVRVFGNILTCSFGSPDVKKAAKSCDNFAVTRPEVANASAQSPNAFVSCFPRSLRARQTPVATIAAPVNNSLRLFPESDMLRNFNTLAQWHEIRRRVCATIET